MITTNDINVVVSAIYRTEGGERTKYPYGVKSIKTSSVNDARHVCYNTVRNFIRKHHIVKVDRYFITMLSNKYCPSSVDNVGNKNWRVNMVRILHLP